MRQPLAAAGAAIVLTALLAACAPSSPAANTPTATATRTGTTATMVPTSPSPMTGATTTTTTAVLGTSVSDEAAKISQHLGEMHADLTLLSRRVAQLSPAEQQQLAQLMSSMMDETTSLTGQLQASWPQMSPDQLQSLTLAFEHLHTAMMEMMQAAGATPVDMSGMPPMDQMTQHMRAMHDTMRSQMMSMTPAQMSSMIEGMSQLMAGLGQLVVAMGPTFNQMDAGARQQMLRHVERMHDIERSAMQLMPMQATPSDLPAIAPQFY